MKKKGQAEYTELHERNNPVRTSERRTAVAGDHGRHGHPAIDRPHGKDTWQLAGDKCGDDGGNLAELGADGTRPSVSGSARLDE